MSPLNLATRWELFVDDYLLAETRGVALKLHAPERREIALTLDAPWEDGAAFPLRVLPWEGGWRLFYRAGILDLGAEDDTQVTAVADSPDGITFTRPELGLIEFEGSTQNNLVQRGGFPNVPPPFRDTHPACPEAERFKGLTARWGEPWAMTSADGLRWRPLHDGALELPGQFDTVNTAFWDTQIGEYRCYTRSWHDPVEGRTVREGEWTPEKQGRVVREIQQATSEDFVHWSAPAPLVYADGDYLAQMYTNAVLSCPGAEHLYLGFPCRFLPDRQRYAGATGPGCNDGLFMTSRDGVHWNRWLDAWLRPNLDERNWGQRNNYPSWGIVTGATEWTMYCNEHYMQPDGTPGRLRRLAVRPFGFVSAHADHAGGEFVTKPLLVGGASLRLNYATSAAGQVQVEVQDPSGKSLAGFGLADRAPLFGNELEATVLDVSTLLGTPVRLRFVLQDADVFALRFA